MLAGQLRDLGDGWISMFKEWADKGLQAGLVCIVVVVMIQRFSIKAGIAALLALVVALGLYSARNDLAQMFEDEVNHPSRSAPVVVGPAVVSGAVVAGPEVRL
ncbi:hypothetical protein [Streptomyces sp. NPDC048489]|uniref:hypothetical protein n=1 Tax=Streptomyces sp. NPDC048489 TaxID=3154504 RepID=UPI00342AF666